MYYSRTLRPNHIDYTWSPNRPHTRPSDFDKTTRLLTVAQLLQRRPQPFPHIRARNPPRFNRRHHSESHSSIAQSKKNYIPGTTLIGRAVSLRADEPYRLPASETTCAHPLSSTEPYHSLKTKSCRIIGCILGDLAGSPRSALLVLVAQAATRATEPPHATYEATLTGPGIGQL